MCACVFCVQLKLMTSWAVVCDVHFLPPQTRRDDETAQQFAERCQVRTSNFVVRKTPCCNVIDCSAVKSTMCSVERRMHNTKNADATLSMICSQLMSHCVL